MEEPRLQNEYKPYIRVGKIAETFEEMKRDGHYAAALTGTVNLLKDSKAGPTVDHIAFILRRKFENRNVWPSIKILTNRDLDEYFHSRGPAITAREKAMEIWNSTFEPDEESVTPAGRFH